MSIIMSEVPELTAFTVEEAIPATGIALGEITARPWTEVIVLQPRTGELHVRAGKHVTRSDVRGALARGWTVWLVKLSQEREVDPWDFTSLARITPDADAATYNDRLLDEAGYAQALAEADTGRLLLNLQRQLRHL